MTAIDKNGLRILFTFERENTTLIIHSTVTNSTSYPMTNFVFKAAVPKVSDLTFCRSVLQNLSFF